MNKPLTTARMEKNFPLWNREPGLTWRDAGNLSLQVAWTGEREYAAAIYDRAACKNLFHQSGGIVSQAMGMTILDGKVKQIQQQQTAGSR